MRNQPTRRKFFYASAGVTALGAAGAAKAASREPALAGGRLWQPGVATAQAKQSAVAEVVKARRFEVVGGAGNTRALLIVSGLFLRDAAENPGRTWS
jgi:hypothetical protein